MCELQNELTFHISVNERFRLLLNICTDNIFFGHSCGDRRRFGQADSAVDRCTLTVTV